MPSRSLLSEYRVYLQGWAATSSLDPAPWQISLRDLVHMLHCPEQIKLAMTSCSPGPRWCGLAERSRPGCTSHPAYRILRGALLHVDVRDQCMQEGKLRAKVGKARFRLPQEYHCLVRVNGLGGRCLGTPHQSSASRSRLQLQDLHI